MGGENASEFSVYHAHHIKKYAFSMSLYLKVLNLISNQCKATKETVAILIVAVVLKVLFPVNACTLDFSSCQNRQRLSEVNDVPSISRAYQGVQNKSKVWQ